MLIHQPLDFDHGLVQLLSDQGLCSCATSNDGEERGEWGGELGLREFCPGKNLL